MIINKLSRGLGRDHLSFREASVGYNSHVRTVMSLLPCIILLGYVTNKQNNNEEQWQIVRSWNVVSIQRGIQECFLEIL